MEITWVGMARDHFEHGDAARIRMLVMHATAGRAPSDLQWLRRGGSDQRPVSVHYYIDKLGAIMQLVRDADVAWHAGVSRWPIDGRTVEGCNAISLGIELENLNDGRDPYPPAQYAAALWLAHHLVQSYAIPRNQLVRHLDIAPGRKTDPAGFPWTRFVAQVYADAEPAGDNLELPVEPLRRLLLEAAYRAAGGSAPEQWPLLDTARKLGLGMPVRAITAREAYSPGRTRPTPGAAQDDQARSLSIGGQSYILEAYAQDLLYAPPDRLDAAQLLSATAPGALREELLQALFRSVDPVSGFQAGWAFHQYFLKHTRTLGVPVGPNHRLTRPAGDGRDYACQHFAFDSLCTPVGQWRTIIRLSELAQALRGELTGGNVAGLTSATVRRLYATLMDDLYHSRTGRVFDPQALLCRTAQDESLGAPLADAEREQLGPTPLLIMPFARDVLYCRAAAAESTANAGSVVGRLSDLVASQTLLGNACFTTTLSLLEQTQAVGAGQAQISLLGAPAATPVVYDLTLLVGAGEPRPAIVPDLVVVYPTPGPVQADLRSAVSTHRPRWHYYVDLTGIITHLADEQQAAHAADSILWSGWSDLNRRSLAIAVESGATALTPAQQQALSWLLRTLMQRFRLKREQILTTPTWFIRQTNHKEGARS